MIVVTLLPGEGVEGDGVMFLLIGVKQFSSVIR